jgi:hypothetical protein
MARSNTASAGLTTGALILIVATLASVVMATPVAAAAPSNDDRAAATTVNAVPFSDSTDTSEATWQQSDPDCGFSGEDDATVWYSFTPSQSGSYLASTAGSDYDTTLTLTVVAGGGLDILDCNDDAGGLDSAIVWDAAAGQEYLIMVGGCCPGGRGHLEFSIILAPPRPTIRLTLAPTARLTRTGAIALHGRVRCQNVARGTVNVSIRQDQRLRIVRGSRGGRFACGSRWDLRVSNHDYRFNRSAVRVVARGYAENVSGSASRRIRRTMDVD